MILRVSWAAAILIGLLAVGPVRAQTASVTARVGDGPLTLERVGGGDLFGTSAIDDPTVSTSTWYPNFGFSYLRPYWAGHGLSLRTTAGSNPAVAVVNAFGDLSNSFGFVPRIDLQYDATGLGFGAAASAQFINLGGNLERTVALSGGTTSTADLIASYNLSVLIVDLPQITKTVRLGLLTDHPLVAHLGREDDTFTFSIGPRFISLQQAWNATLRAGSTVASSNASQTFAGLGLTAGLATDHPCSERWGVYSNSRVSLVIGPNNRKSVENGGDNSGPFDNTLIENRTVLLPVVEIEWGIRYSAPLDSKRWQASRAGPLLSVRTGFVGQFWGGVGFLPASAGDARFTNSPLYLVGATVLVGVEF